GLYYDEGISGTKMEKREGLLALLKDCEDGKIDRVITKSISRFSRNTTDCLEMVRRLASLNIYLFFEKENIDTEHMSSELMLSILSSIAESESRSISENEKWSIAKRYQNGTFIIGYPPFGYDNVDGKMVIVPEEAEIVKEIFTMAINGMGSYVIAKELNKRGIRTKKNGKWGSSAVKGLLHNEKYTGDVVFQKTYTDDNFNRHNNYGEKNMYLCENHHEAIVSHEVFKQAEIAMEQRGKEKSIIAGDEKYQNRYVFSGRILCGECGSPFKRRQHYKPSGAYVAWTCRLHIEDKDACSMLYIHDEAIKNAFIRMMRKLQAADIKMLKPFVAGLEGKNNKDRLHQVMDLEDAIEKNTEQQTVLVNLMSAGYLEPEIFHMEKNQLVLEADELSKEKERISKSINGDLTHLEEAKKLLRFAAKKSKIENFDDDMFLEYVDTITVKSREEIVFNLKCGLHLTERLVEE
ncbi:MAG: recombinase family protein, partial [Eubacteriales bacterium]|nr:recombinase family protein [Eubacteriales bacterium]